MTPPTTQVTLGGYALVLLVVLAAGFGIGRAAGTDPAPQRAPAPHSQTSPQHAPHAHPEEQS
ncbi:hypothetical protein ACIBK8_01435 [Streptomyces sp. NPDC050161]|uniref:hypothetical protein n=1 Tax=Streptomyces sp. NPDC050161 TaxID=3365604 RepID=UPI0037B066DB